MPDVHLRREEFTKKVWQNFIAHIHGTRDKIKISQRKVFWEVSRLIQVNKKEVNGV